VDCFICDNNALKHDKLWDIVFCQAVIQRNYEHAKTREPMKY